MANVKTEKKEWKSMTENEQAEILDKIAQYEFRTLINSIDEVARTTQKTVLTINTELRASNAYEALNALKDYGSIIDFGVATEKITTEYGYERTIAAEITVKGYDYDKLPLEVRPLINKSMHNVLARFGF